MGLLHSPPAAVVAGRGFCHDTQVHLISEGAAVLDRIDHIGIACHDLAAKIAFYQEVFDLAVVSQEVNEEQGVREAMLRVSAARGVRLLDQRPRHGSMGAAIAFLHPADVGGVLTELVQAAGDTERPA
jgi:methylmalonyl-CoA/ethylmalonyl-CoA epimerase